MVREKFPSTIFLVETKCLQTQMEKIKGKMGAKCCFAVSSIGRREGLAILWYEGVELEIVNFSNCHINTKFKDDTTRNEWFLIGFYGIPETSKMANSWCLLGRINKGPNVGWCVISDFNEIITQDEEIGSRP